MRDAAPKKDYFLPRYGAQDWQEFFMPLFFAWRKDNVSLRRASRAVRFLFAIAQTKTAAED